MPALGFVILRHVDSTKADGYWKLCYDSVRRLYADEPVLIIDDDSDPALVTPHPTTNTTVVQSEYPGRGELLPFIYYLRHKISDRAVFLHDTVFLQAKVPFFDNMLYQHLWAAADHCPDGHAGEVRMLGALKDPPLALHSKKTRWFACFGAMVIITHEMLCSVDKAYTLANLADVVLTKDDRRTFKRVVACLLRTLYDTTPPPVYGNIQGYCPPRCRFEDRAALQHLPAVKVWGGR